MSVSDPIFDPALQQFLHRLGRRILYARMLMELSDDELECRADEDQADLKARPKTA